MICKVCGKQLEHSIEGELICDACWMKSQMSQEELNCEKEIREYLNHKNKSSVSS